MNQTKEIADSYHSATVKGACYGPSLAELLARTTPVLATTPPTTSAHSICVLLQHILLWNERVRETSEEKPMPVWEAEREWAEPSIPWSELVPRWSESRNLLGARIRDFPPGELAEEVPGRSYSYEWMFRGIVQHTIYHSGQIAMILSIPPPAISLGTRARNPIHGT